MITTLCRICGIELSESNWYFSSKKVRERICKSCVIERSVRRQRSHKEQHKNAVDKYRRKNRKKINKRSRETYRLNIEENREKLNKRARNRNQLLRREVLGHYSPNLSCIRCGETNLAALSIHHVNNNGLEDRKRRGWGSSLHYSLRREGYPEGYQVLCMNCNWLKREGLYDHLKTDVISHYSNNTNRCSNCTCSDMKVLTIDHISGRGNEHKRSLRRTGTEFYRWLRINKYPAGYRVLCMNCQFIKRKEVVK